MRKTILSSLLILALAVWAGCGSKKSTTPSTTTVPNAQNKNTAVLLNEMNIIPERKSTGSGKVTFLVQNQGKIPHEMVVLRTDQPAGSLGSGMSVPETGKAGETGDMAAGQNKTLSLDLKPGHYALICNLPGHYAAGMHADFTVS